MHVTLSVSDKPEQSGKTRPCCVISNWHMNMCGPGWLAASAGADEDFVRARLFVRDKTPPPGSLGLPSIPQRHSAALPIIALSSLFKVYIRCLNMYRNSCVCCVLLCMCPWDNCFFVVVVFLRGYNTLPSRDFLSPDSMFSTVNRIPAVIFPPPQRGKRSCFVLFFFCCCFFMPVSLNGVHQRSFSCLQPSSLRTAFLWFNQRATPWGGCPCFGAWGWWLWVWIQAWCSGTGKPVRPATAVTRGGAFCQTPPPGSACPPAIPCWAQNAS